MHPLEEGKGSLLCRPKKGKNTFTFRGRIGGRASSRAATLAAHAEGLQDRQVAVSPRHEAGAVRLTEVHPSIHWSDLYLPSADTWLTRQGAVPRVWRKYSPAVDR